MDAHNHGRSSSGRVLKTFICQHTSLQELDHHCSRGRLVGAVVTSGSCSSSSSRYGQQQQHEDAPAQPAACQPGMSTIVNLPILPFAGAQDVSSDWDVSLFCLCADEPG
jgi:hypothetical protein